MPRTRPAPTTLVDILSSRSKDALDEIERIINDVELQKQRFKERVQNEIGKLVKLKLVEYPINGKTLLGCTCGEIKYTIGENYAAEPGVCYAIAETVDIERMAVVCRPWKLLTTTEINKECHDLQEIISTETSDLSSADMRADYMLETLRFYKQRKDVLPNVYEKKLPAYLEEFSALKTSITRKLTQFRTFDKPVHLTFGRYKGSFGAQHNGVTVAEFDIIPGKRTPVVTPVKNATGYTAAGYDNVKLLDQLFDQLPAYLKIDRLWKADEVYVVAGEESVEARILENKGFTKERRIEKKRFAYYRKI